MELYYKEWNVSTVNSLQKVSISDYLWSYKTDAMYTSFSSGEAENIIDTDYAVLEMPKGPITFDDLEKARRAQSKFFIEK